jgi:hypothetical protein
MIQDCVSRITTSAKLSALRNFVIIIIIIISQENKKFFFVLGQNLRDSFLSSQYNTIQYKNKQKQVQKASKTYNNCRRKMYIIQKLYF